MTGVRRAAARRRGDEQLADRVARDLAVLGTGAVRRFSTTGQTIDGEQPLETIVATRPGSPGPGIVIVAHRDAAGPAAEAELSGTAALVELARVAAAGALRRTITFVSTSGGSGGLAGARAAIAELPRPVDAVLVLGDVASRNVRKPWVVGWSNAKGVAPLRLQRTVAAAVRAETGQDAGGSRVGAQWARLAFPMTVSEQGAFLAEGLPSVLLSATGERPPGRRRAGLRAAAHGLRAGRAAHDLRPGQRPDDHRGPRVAAGHAPQGAARLGGHAADRGGAAARVGRDRRCFARVRRRRQPVGEGVRWVLASTVPFLGVALLAALMGLVGLIGARPAAPVPAGALTVDGTAVAVMLLLALVFLLAWMVARPGLLRVPACGSRSGTGTRRRRWWCYARLRRALGGEPVGRGAAGAARPPVAARGRTRGAPPTGGGERLGLVALLPLS